MRLFLVMITLMMLTVYCNGNITSQSNATQRRNYMRCMHHLSFILKISSSRPGAPVNFSNPPWYPGQTNLSALCHYMWVNDSEWFSGISQVIFAGDSTIMRTFQYVVRGSDKEYHQKVQKLQDPVLIRHLNLTSGRQVKIIFVRTLHISTAIPVVDAIFDIADAKSLIIFSFGPHDTSWLVFRKAMPHYKKTWIGNFNHAALYWVKHTIRVTSHIAWRLWMFHKFSKTNTTERPVVLLREQFLPNCRHPKYSKYPLITRCPDLLLPRVVPFYRAVLKAYLGIVGIPVISMDALMPPCSLEDAGHIVKWCKRYEFGMSIMAYRLLRMANVEQGFSSACLKEGACTSIFALMKGNWSTVNKQLEKLPTDELELQLRNKFQEYYWMKNSSGIELDIPDEELFVKTTMLKSFDGNGSAEIKIVKDPKSFLPSNMEEPPNQTENGKEEQFNADETERSPINQGGFSTDGLWFATIIVFTVVVFCSYFALR